MKVIKYLIAQKYKIEDTPEPERVNIQYRTEPKFTVWMEAFWRMIVTANTTSRFQRSQIKSGQISRYNYYNQRYHRRSQNTGMELLESQLRRRFVSKITRERTSIAQGSQSCGGGCRCELLPSMLESSFFDSSSS